VLGKRENCARLLYSHARFSQEFCQGSHSFTRTLDILLCHRRLERNGYPSWAPELSGFESQSAAWFHSNLPWVGRCQGTSRCMEADFDLDNGLLHVREFALGVRLPPLHLIFPGIESQLIVHLQPLYNQIEANLTKRCFITINDEFMAVGPYHTKPSNVVAILFSGFQCFILRPCCCGTKFGLIGTVLFIDLWMDTYANMCLTGTVGR
jgi:hypothetical protein